MSTSLGAELLSWTFLTLVFCRADQSAAVSLPHQANTGVACVGVDQLLGRGASHVLQSTHLLQARGCIRLRDRRHLRDQRNRLRETYRY
jgi:hypothetical protein